MTETAIRRVDRRTFKHDATSVVAHRCGWVDVWGVAAIAGVLQYPEHGTAEYVDAAELGRPDSLSTVHGVPLTIGHPPDGSDVTSANAQDLTHGWVLAEEIRDGELWTQIRFATDDVLAALKAGTVELSLGYDAVYIDEAGTAPDGTPYTGRQQNRRYNHISLVDLARAGHGARVRLDSARRDARRLGMHKLAIGKHTRQIAKFMADALQAESAKLGSKRDEIEVAEIMIDGTKLILPKEMVDALLASLGLSSGAEAAPPSDQPMDSATGGGAPANLRTDKRGEQVDVAAEVRRQVQDAVAQERRRADVERKAHPILGDGHDYSDPWATAAAAIERVDEAKGTEAKRRLDAIRNPKADAVSKAEAQGYLLARLDDALDAHRDAHDSSGDLGFAIDEARRSDAKDGGTEKKITDPVADARSRMRDRLYNRKATTTAAAAK